jgi:GNAT superfamily N-acetyltransferase
VPTVVDVWVDAFVGDPYLRWIAPSDDAWKGFGPAWLGFIADLCFERGHTFLADGDVMAVAWIPPDLSLVGPDDIARGRGIIAEHSSETRAEEALTTIMAARGHGMEQPHWTLQYIGVRPGHQGSGLGAAAVEPGLVRCDDDGLPCGLVSSNPKNVPFYERLGFVVVAEESTPDGAATLRPMERHPR